MQIGDTLYIRDRDRRLYQNDDGTKRQTPNPRYAFVACEIVAENQRSWILSNDLKADKATLALRTNSRPGLEPRVYTQAGCGDAVWRAEYAQDIFRLVQRADTPALRKIAVLLGMEE